MSQDIGPVYYPDRPEYIETWHEQRGDVKGEDGLWRDSETGEVVNPADFPLLEEGAEAEIKQAKKEGFIIK